MILWGMGLPLGIFTVAGTIMVTGKILLSIAALQNDPAKSLFGKFRTITAPKTLHWGGQNEPTGNLAILFSFFLPYFLITGSFAVKFMRYWLPLYPLFCIFAALFTFQASVFLQKRMSVVKRYLPARQNVLSLPRRLLASLLAPGPPMPAYLRSLWLGYLLLVIIWPLSFISIYSQPNTRIQATKWINKNIPSGSVLAVEHWDDRLPLQGNYKFLEMPMYESDNSSKKWKIVNDNLEKADYIIIASNRLYTPLMKLTDCKNLPQDRCYPKTAAYYQKLFSGWLGFTKTAEFTSYPKLEIGNWKLEIDDSSADESFTVYDHPKIMIFKKTRCCNRIQHPVLIKY